MKEFSLGIHFIYRSSSGPSSSESASSSSLSGASSISFDAAPISSSSTHSNFLVSVAATSWRKRRIHSNFSIDRRLTSIQSSDRSDANIYPMILFTCAGLNSVFNTRLAAPPRANLNIIKSRFSSMMKFPYTAERNSGSSMSLYKLTEKSNACKRMALH